MAYAEVGENRPSLLQILDKTKLINPSQHALLSNRLAGQNDKEIGIYLVNSGYVDQPQVFSALENDFMEKMRQLFTWSEGAFRFETGELPPEERIPARMELENLIVEGARELHEIEELKAEIPSLEMMLKFTDRPGTDIRNYNLSAEEWRVVSYINPKNTMEQIAKATKLDEIQIRRVVYALLQAGLVEIIRPGGKPISLPVKMFPTKDTKEQKSLVQRLINHIRSI